MAYGLWTMDCGRGLCPIVLSEPGVGGGGRN